MKKKLKEMIKEEREKFFNVYKKKLNSYQTDPSYSEMAKLYLHGYQIYLENICDISEAISEMIVDDKDLNEIDMKRLQKINYDILEFASDMENKVKSGEV